MIDTRLPLYQQLRDDFLHRIQTGEWSPDAALPSENELCESLGVAVGTVRKALDVLVAEGVLVRQQGRGTFLRRASFDASLFRFFRHEDREGRRRVPDSHILSRRGLQADAGLADLLRLAPGEPVLGLNRLRRIDGEVVLVEEIRLPATRFALLADLPIEEFSPLLYPLYERLCGQIVTSARESLAVATANAEIAAHLGIALGSPIVEIERLALDCTGQPIEWRRSWGRGDRFRYRVDIR